MRGQLQPEVNKEKRQREGVKDIERKSQRKSEREKGRYVVSGKQCVLH